MCRHSKLKAVAGVPRVPPNKGAGSRDAAKRLPQVSRVAAVAIPPQKFTKGAVQGEKSTNHPTAAIPVRT